MNKVFDPEKFWKVGGTANQFDDQIERLKGENYDVDHIKETVDRACQNLSSANPSPFIIYGEPQSGKTEMMICLTAKLLDLGYEFIALLLNDSLDLLQQNLLRFQTSDLAPSPQNFLDILDPDHEVRGIRHIVFCKKNHQDLQKLIDKIDSLKGKIVIIDDEADYATPNAKINSLEKTKTKINELIETLLGAQGIYIGVTATPARLDLNNTFGTNAAEWIDFKTHSRYFGQNEFFPIDGQIQYDLKLLKDSGNERQSMMEALFGFLVAVAYLNLHEQQGKYSMLIHTSGRQDAHQNDKVVIEKVFECLVTKKSRRQYVSTLRKLFDKAVERYPQEDPYQLTEYVLKNISKRKLVVLNARNVKTRGQDATNPTSLFTIVIGGNIVSRGVTLKNLLSMYFTRDVQNKIQQDTYIQRARMFGVRGDYFKHFELSIPENLYNDWHRCFVYHRLSLDGARNGNVPIWMTDRRVSVVAASSIDKANVYNAKASELSFGAFTNQLTDVLQICKSDMSHKEKLTYIESLLPEDAFPKHLLNFVTTFEKGENAIAVYVPDDVSDFKPDPQRDDDIPNIVRSRGFWGQFERDRIPAAIHHFKIFHYKQHKGKLFYKYDCENIKSLTFLRNLTDYD